MIKFSKIINHLDFVKGVSSNCSEDWSFLTFQGIYSPRYSTTHFKELYDSLDEIGLSKAVVFRIDDEKLNINDFVDNIVDNDRWTIHINKSAWLNNTDEDGAVHTFFYSVDKFKEWIQQTNPFVSEYPLNENRVHILVNNLQESFGGPNFIVNDSDSVDGWDNTEFISTEQIEQSIRIVCNQDYIIAPQKHLVTFGKISDASISFFINSIRVLLASLCDEVSKEPNFIIRGHKKITANLLCGETFYDKDLFDYQNLLIDVAKWIYSSTETCVLKKRLFAERVSIDMDNNISLLEELHPILQDVYSQITEQYSYIIYERKDAYQKELKELLKDIKSLTDSFSAKIRSILGNLLRDVLAALVLVGITLFSKIQELEKLSDNNLIDYVFNAFGVYFIASVILQLIFDAIDVRKSFKELNYWKNITHTYVSNNQFEEYKNQTIGNRMCSMISYYILIVFLYVLISIGCFNYSTFWKTHLSQPPHNVENIIDSLQQSKQDTINIITPIGNDTII